MILHKDWCPIAADPRNTACGCDLSRHGVDMRGTVYGLKKTDWKLLQAQKETLAKLERDPRLSETEKEHITGVLNLLDSLQDAFML